MPLDNFEGAMCQPNGITSTYRKRASHHGIQVLHDFVELCLRAFVTLLLCLTLQPCLRADTISGTIKDPSGATVAGARIEISGGNLVNPLVLTSDESGRFAASNLTPAKYSVRVAKEGFDESVTAVDLRGTADLDLKLTIAGQQTSVNVTEKNLAFANSD